jgi:WD40 repeat protein/Flp pilus assembly protein TadD
MSVFLTCPQGHQWQAQESPDAPSLCPLCGSAADDRPHDSRPAVLPPTRYFDSAAELDNNEMAGPVVVTAGPGTHPAAAPTLLRGPEDSLPPHRSTPLEVRSIPGHEIIEEIGRGGMGVVYKARQIGLNRIVALKMVLAGVRADSQVLARFKAEAAAVARLQHPNIVQVYEIGEHDGCPYFSLEYVDGGTLAQKLDSTPQPPRLAAHLIMTLAIAIHTAHQRGIIHRDLKPGNVLLAAVAQHVTGPDTFHVEGQASFRFYGIPKIADFGLAKHLGEDMAQTRTGAILGTPSYMAPEQAEGRVHAIGPGTDVYALGAILYEMLTGRPPFAATSALDTVLQVMHSEPVPPCRLQPKVPRDLETICLKCLNKEPRKRYLSAEDLAEDLRRYLEGHPIEARPLGRWGRALKWVRRHPAWTGTIAVSALATVLLIAGAVSYHIELQYAVDDARASAAESRRNLVRLHVARGTTAMDGGNGFAALTWLTEALRLDADSRHEPMHRLRLATVLRQCPHLARLWVQDRAVNAAQFSPDGQLVVTAGDDGLAHLWDVASGKACGEPLAHPDGVLDALFSRDSRYLATACRDGTARVWDCSNGQPLTPPLKHGPGLRALALSPDDRLLVTAGGDREARVWSVPGGKPVTPGFEHGAVIRTVAFSPDGSWLAAASTDGTARVWDVKTHEVRPFVLQHGGAVTCVVFSFDGRYLATASRDRTARVWESATGVAVGPPLRHGEAVLWVAFSPHDHRLLSGGEDGVARIWNAATGEPLGEPLRHSSPVRYGAFSPDGCLVVTGGDDNVARVWSALNGAPQTPPLRSNGSVTCCSFSPDGRLVLAAGDDGTARLWHVACGQPWTTLDQAASFRRQAASLLDPAAPLIVEPPSAGPPSATSPDGRQVVRAGPDNLARVHDAVTGDPITPPLQHRSAVTSVAFSPDGRLVLTTSIDWTARLWDAANGQPVGEPMTHPSAVLFGAFSPDGSRIVTTGDDNTARVWDARSTALVLPPLKHHGTVVQASFDGEGRRVATASKDRTARVWDAGTGQALTPPLQHPWPVHQAHFSSDGQRLLTTGENGTVRSWELPAIEQPTEDLVKLAQLLSGTRIDDSRGAMPVEPAELGELWQDLSGRYPELFVPPAADVLAWHRHTALACVRGRRWESAVWHFDQLIQAEPEQWLYRARRGLARAELGRWKEADEDFAWVVERQPKETEVRCLHALLRLQAGDASGYRRACSELLESAGTGDHAAYLAAWTCTLAADAVADPGRLVALATRTVSSRPTDPEYLTTLALSLYRSGQFNAAARRLNEALAVRGSGAAARDWILLALVRHRAGQAVEARLWLDRAAQRLGHTPPSSLPWIAQLQLRLLQREAETLFGTAPASTPHDAGQ